MAPSWREFGIPALASVPGILDAVADGDLLDVDAGAGQPGGGDREA